VTPTRVSEGAALLAAAGSITATAKATGFPERSISAYRSGRRTPDGPHAAALERVLGIPAAAWSRAPNAPERSPSLTVVPSPLPSVTPPAPATDGERESANESTAESATERLRAQMARLKARREAGGLSATAAATIERLELAASVALGRLEGSELTMAQVLSSAHWERLCAVIIAAVDPYPLAFGAIERELLALQGRPPTTFLADVEADHPAEYRGAVESSKALRAAMAERAERITSRRAA